METIILTIYLLFADGSAVLEARPMPTMEKCIWYTEHLEQTIIDEKWPVVKRDISCILSPVVKHTD